MKKNEFIILEITAMSSEGSGIGRYEGLAVFVPMTAVGDKVRVKIVKVKSNCAFGIIELFRPPPIEPITIALFSSSAAAVLIGISPTKASAVSSRIRCTRR